MNYYRSDSDYNEKEFDDPFKSIPFRLMDIVGLESDGLYELVEEVVNNSEDSEKASVASVSWAKGVDAHVHGYIHKAARNFDEAIETAAEVDEDLAEVYRQNLEKEHPAV